MTLRTILLALLLSVGPVLSGCTTDALYSYCTAPEQCGSRTYDDGDVEVTVDLDCVDVEVELGPSERTRGAMCTLECFDSRDCDSRVGLPDGECIAWDGEDIFYCYQRCDVDEDCYPSSTCAEVTLDGSPSRVCLPNRS